MAEETFDFFHAGEGEEYVFYRVPKLLFTEERFRRISTDARMLYGLMLDRLGLSQKNGWTDKNGRLYIYFTLEDVANALGVGRQKASQLLAELEKYKLILRKRQGLGKPNRIYVGRFTQRAGPSHFQKYGIHTLIILIRIILIRIRSYLSIRDLSRKRKPGQKRSMRWTEELHLKGILTRSADLPCSYRSIRTDWKN